MQYSVSTSKNPNERTTLKMTVTDKPINIEMLRAFIAPEAPVIPDVIAAQARELDDIRSALKILEDRQSVIRASLLDHLATEGVDSVTDGTISISRATHQRTGIDKARMEALYPKVLADCATSTPVTQVRVKIKG
jgi:hypothetical protein